MQPDRDVTGKQRSPRSKKLEVTARTPSDDSSDWTMRLPLDVRSLMMHLMNIEAQVVRGQVSPYSQECPPVRNRKGTLRDIFEKPGFDNFPGERYEVIIVRLHFIFSPMFQKLPRQCWAGLSRWYPNYNMPGTI